MKKESNTKKTVKRKAVKSETKKVEFNKYSLYLQTLSIFMVLVAVALNIADIISTEIMLDIFCIGVIVLACSLFPKRK